MRLQNQALRLCEDMLKLAIIEAGLGNDPGVVTAGETPENIVNRIEVIRKKIRQEADEVTVDCMQQLAGLLRQVTHVLTDLVYSKAARGENGKPMQKLQDQIMNVLKNLAINGFEDEDRNRDGFRDDAELDFLTEEPDEHQDVHDAIKIALKNAKRVNRDLEQHDAQAPAKPDVEPEEDEPQGEDSDEPEDTESEEQVKPVKNLMKPPAKPKVEPEENEPSEEDEPSEDNFMGDLLAEDEEDEKPAKKGKAKADPEYSDDIVTAAQLSQSIGYATTAGLRFMYMGLREVKGRGGEKVLAIKTAVGDNSRDPDNITAYYYVIDGEAKKPLFGGDIRKLDKAYTKLLRTENGYAALMQAINAAVRAQQLYVLGKKVIPLKSAISDSPRNYWNFLGLREHPKQADKGAIWVDLGAQKYALVPKQGKDSEKLSDTANWLKAALVGGKESGGTGMSYQQGFEFLTKLLETGTLPGIPCALKTIYRENV